MAAWWDTHITQGFKWGWAPARRAGVGTQGGHSGIDLAEADGTPLTTPVSGRVIHAAAHAWGGQVSILFTASGGPMTLTCIHMSQIAPGIQRGADVNAGDLIGRTGGGRDSRPIPTSCCSNGPHLHFEMWIGDHAPYVDQSPWKSDADHHPVDPTNFFYALKKHGIPNDQSGLGLALSTSDANAPATSTPNDAASGPAGPDGGAGDRAHAMLVEFPGFYGIVAALDQLETFNPWLPPSRSIPPDTGDVQLRVGALRGQVHVPGLSDVAYAAAEGRTLSNTVGYAASWLGGNALALLLRLLLIALGVGLVAALLYAQARKSALLQPAVSGEQAEQVAQVAKIAAIAA